MAIASATESSSRLRSHDHALHNTAITSVYRATKDLFLTQRFARHANPITTVAYTHPSDEELYEKIGGL